jgi:hypothetical protein
MHMNDYSAVFKIKYLYNAIERSSMHALHLNHTINMSISMTHVCLHVANAPDVFK